MFLNYPNGTSEEIRNGIIRDLASLQNEISGIIAFGNGPNVSPESAVVRGFQDMFWFDFQNEQTRDAYLANETHKRIAARITAAVDGGADGVFVCDVAI